MEVDDIKKLAQMYTCIDFESRKVAIEISKSLSDNEKEEFIDAVLEEINNPHEYSLNEDKWDCNLHLGQKQLRLEFFNSTKKFYIIDYRLFDVVLVLTFDQLTIFSPGFIVYIKAVIQESWVD